MARPSIEPHLQRLLTSEKIFVGSLFTLGKGDSEYFCSLYAPGDSALVVLEPSSLYAWAIGDTAEDAIYAAREGLWKGL